MTAIVCCRASPSNRSCHCWKLDWVQRRFSACIKKLTTM